MTDSIPSQRSSILIVDDIPKNLQVVGTILRQEGYSVIPAMSGAEALEGLQEKAPDLILLDLIMPEIDGLEVCRRIKSNPDTQSIPVIFLTASNEMEHLVQGFEQGAVDYVTKPFNPPELLARVRTHLELKHAREKLRELNDEKNEFMGIAAHDLRSPLNAIQGYAEMALEDGAPNEECADILARIQTGAQKMSEMIQNLLDVNRIERGEMVLKMASNDLAAIIKSVLESQIPRAVAKDQSISFAPPAGPVMLESDASAMTQIIDNLVSNAIKYSPKGKSILIRLSKEPDSVRIEVQDEGPGLSEEDQKKLFGKFARLSAKPTNGEQSIGLGLSIVKRMVETMNGHIHCESTLGQGATFIATFPFSP